MLLNFLQPGRIGIEFLAQAPDLVDRLIGTGRGEGDRVSLDRQRIDARGRGEDPRHHFVTSPADADDLRDLSLDLFPNRAGRKVLQPTLESALVDGRKETV